MTTDPLTIVAQLGAIDPELPETELFEAVALVFDQVPLAERRDVFIELDEKPGRYPGYAGKPDPQYPEWHWKLRRTRNNAPAELFDRILGSNAAVVYVTDVPAASFTLTPSGAAKIAEHTGDTPEAVAEAARQQGWAVPAENAAPAPSSPTRPPGFGPPRPKYALAEVGDRVTYDVWHDGRVIGSTTFIVVEVDTRQWQDQYCQWVEDADGLERHIGFYDSSVIIEPPL